MIASPRPMPPATNTGTSRISGRISCASTLVATGPIWPPASMPSITMRIGARAHQLLGDRPAPGRSTSSLAPPASRAACAAGRQAAGEHDMPDLVIEADLDQLLELRMHGDEVDAERPVGSARGRRDLGREQGGRHRAARR